MTERVPNKEAQCFVDRQRQSISESVLLSKREKLPARDSLTKKLGNQDLEARVKGVALCKRNQIPHPV